MQLLSATNISCMDNAYLEEEWNQGEVLACSRKMETLQSVSSDRVVHK